MMRKTLIGIVFAVMAGCNSTMTTLPTPHTTPETRQADCEEWAARAQAEEDRAKRLDGGKGTYTAQTNAKMYREAMATECGIPTQASSSTKTR
jgi:hypothetical protein